MSTSPVNASIDGQLAVQLEQVRVERGGRVLLHVPGLTVCHGERVAIVGPNGAGKSTLLRVLAGLVDPTTGSVQVLGHMQGGEPRRGKQGLPRHEIGLLMQGLHLVPRLSARENVIVGALARLQGAEALRSWLRWYPASVMREAHQALTALGLHEMADMRADRLSGGERQKLAVARLQLQRPRLVLADEPTAALDPSATRQVCDALRALAQPEGRTLISVVHDTELLPLLATRVIGIADGEVQWDVALAALEPEQLEALYRPRHAASGPSGSGQHRAGIGQVHPAGLPV